MPHIFFCRVESETTVGSYKMFEDGGGKNCWIWFRYLYFLACESDWARREGRSGLKSDVWSASGHHIFRLPGLWEGIIGHGSAWESNFIAEIHQFASCEVFKRIACHVYSYVKCGGRVGLTKILAVRSDTSKPHES